MFAWVGKRQSLTGMEISSPAICTFAILFIPRSGRAWCPCLAFLPDGLRSFFPSLTELITAYPSALQLLKLCGYLSLFFSPRFVFYKKPFLYVVLVGLQDSEIRCMCLVHQLKLEAGTSLSLLDPVHFYLLEAKGQVH